jgi:FkbM family methyltransferase
MSAPQHGKDGKAHEALEAAAEQLSRLDALRASGALGRWQASQSAISNSFAPRIARANTFWGGTLEVDIRDAVGSSVFIHGSYEPELSAALYQLLQPGQTFVDVGAHIGYFSLLAADRVGDRGKVVSLEPCERTFWSLTRNTQASKNVQRHRVAAWDSGTTLSLNDYGPLHSAFNSIGDRRIHESAPPVKSTPFEVRAVALDEFFEETQTVPDVIKIDAESAEEQVLEGLRRTLQSVRPVITLEVGDYEHLLAKGVARSSDILRSLDPLGYILLEPTLDGLHFHGIRDGLYAYGNILGVPEEKASQTARSWQHSQP